MFYTYFMFNNLLNGIDGLTIVKQEITFHRTFRSVGIKWLADREPDSYERFWTYIFPAENVKLLIKKTT